MNTKSNRPLRSRRHRSGFSLVELLTVIAIVGVLASVSIAAMSGIGDESRITAAKGQAQRIASTFNAGLAAGSQEFTSANGVDNAMNKVGSGDHGSGSLSNVYFRLAGISSTMDDGKPEEEQAKHYLSWAGGTLIYNASGGGPSGGGSLEPPAEEDLTGWSPLPDYIASALLSNYQSILPSATLADLVAALNSSPERTMNLRLSGGQLYNQPVQQSPQYSQLQ